jgi:MerR family transcriptional regulator/heat shock protein HspR
MDKKKETEEIHAVRRVNLPLLPISVVSDLTGIKQQTLRLYERHGLIKPARRNKNRIYSENDIKWLRCLKDLIYEKKINPVNIKKLLRSSSCWKILSCPEKKRHRCTAYINPRKPCWEINHLKCYRQSGEKCDDCIVYLAERQYLKAS